MLSSSDLKKFFDEDRSFEQDGKRIYLVPLKEFMKTEEFSKFPSVTYIDKDLMPEDIKSEDDRKKECHFLNSICWTDVHPHMIIGKTKSEKTVWYVDLDEQSIGGSFPNVEYELMVRVNEDGTLNRDFVRQIQKARKKILREVTILSFYKHGCIHYYPTNEPRYYYDPSF